MKKNPMGIIPFVSLIGLGLVLVLPFASCGGNQKKAAPEPVVIRWWHINSDSPSHELFEALAREFEKANPGVTVRVTLLENMEFRQKLDLEFAAGDSPDIFHSWGGGGLAEHSRKGYVRDITDWVRSDRWQSSINEAALNLYSYKGKIHGFPHDLGAVGFWYNSELLAKAGYKAFPSDWDSFLALCEDLKKIGITPVSLGFADRWPVMFWWSYLSLRIGGPGFFDEILEGKRDFSDPALVKAGYMLQDFYRRGYLPATALGDDFASQSRYMGDGLAAMQLMGQWALAVQAQNSEKKDALSDLMRFAPFPAVKGGAGSPGDVLGGGNGFVIGGNAPDKAIELLEYFTRAENLQRYFDIFPGIPTVQAVRIESPGLNMVKEYLLTMRSFSLYPDQMYSQEVNNQINDVSARIMLGKISPEEGCAALQEALRKERAER